LNKSIDHIFTSKDIGNLTLKNRIIKAACFEGMSQGGKVTDALIEHHRQIAAGGVAMTTVAYCSVSFDGRAYDHELWMREDLVPDLKRLTDAVHRESAAASIQLGHCGYFASKRVIGTWPLGASPKFNLFRLSLCKQMTENDIETKINDFVNAAILSKEAGFDAVEIHAGHGYLLSQFLSPFTNKRKDKYGGSLENRMRFPTEVIKRISAALGLGFPILVKMNLFDGMKNGLQLEEAIEVAKVFESSGASALIPSSGFTSKTPFLMLRGKLPILEMVANQRNLIRKLGLLVFGKFLVQEYRFTNLFHLEAARKVREANGIPVIYIGGVKTADDLEKLMNDGFDFVQLGRTLIHNPDFVKDFRNQRVSETFCDHCNRCVAAMDGGGVYCVSKEKGYMPPG
jgi:2,4-dienoyl-CoA reductase-like NADH-dependent reductase (Old Yellow Enzyme family)